MFCRNCGKKINEKAEICVNCGVRPLAERKFCQECGAETKQNQELCVKCGVRLKTLMAVSETGVSLQTDFSGLSQYYQDEFTKIYKSNESYKGKWNWSAFLFGALWALTKGLWLSAVICLFVCLLTAGIAGFIYWFIYGARGNYMYYCAYVKKKQLVV
jgi:RNA polymerase subunit RPABC4/transcription elongation factor Spt4